MQGESGDVTYLVIAEVVIPGWYCLQFEDFATLLSTIPNPKFLFIDEGTSNLDIISERKVSQNIAALGITGISVAHRPEVIQSADIVFEMPGLL